MSSTHKPNLLSIAAAVHEPNLFQIDSGPNEPNVSERPQTYDSNLLRAKLAAMESFFVDFMVETVERFQSLTDAKIFLLIESDGNESEKRYFGSHHFIRQYESTGLFSESANPNWPRN